MGDNNNQHADSFPRIQIQIAPQGVMIIVFYAHNISSSIMLENDVLDGIIKARQAQKQDLAKQNNIVRKIHEEREA